MNTTRNGNTPGSSRKMPRRGRNNPARHEAVPIGEWEADERTAKGERAERIAAARQDVTPDTVVTCPVCGSAFRVGKRVKR